ncbi:MAG: hypothetical protein JSS10_08500 [Verrucomicrobia bacterium]|nr:hypothetical protein [Verrucomicrobiota bacterium]
MRFYFALGASRLILVGVLTSKEGLNKIKNQHPDVTTLVAATDLELNNSKFIVIGIGDFGDRYFGS